MTDKSIESVDDLSYDWPANVLEYETRFFLGLSPLDLILVGIIAMAGMIVNLFLGLLGGVVCLLLVLRWDFLGGRRLPLYLWAWLRHRLARRPVVLPRILPAGGSGKAIRFFDLDGRQVAQIGDDRP